MPDSLEGFIFLSEARGKLICQGQEVGGHDGDLARVVKVWNSCGGIWEWDTETPCRLCGVTCSCSAQQHGGRSMGGGECLDRSKVGYRAGGAGREEARTLGMSGGARKGFTESHCEFFQNRKRSHEEGIGWEGRRGNTGSIRLKG